MTPMIQLTPEVARRIYERAQALRPLEEWSRFWIDGLEPGVFPEGMGKPEWPDIIGGGGMHHDESLSTSEGKKTLKELIELLRRKP